MYWHSVEFFPPVKLKNSYRGLVNVTRSSTDIVVSRKTGRISLLDALSSQKAHLYFALFSQFCQVGNFSIHIALRNLKLSGQFNLTRNVSFNSHRHYDSSQLGKRVRRCFNVYCLISGSKAKKIPYPTKNPFTWIFWLVSCPNYTYEVSRYESCLFLSNSTNIQE